MSKLPKDSYKKSKLEEHKNKMLLKKRQRQRVYEILSRGQYIPANLGVNHPDYNMSMKDHLIEKEKRNQGN